MWTLKHPFKEGSFLQLKLAVYLNYNFKFMEFQILPTGMSLYTRADEFILIVTW